MNEEENTIFHEMTYTDENGTYSISRFESHSCLTALEVIEDFVRPILLAAGYSESTVKDGLEQSTLNW